MIRTLYARIALTLVLLLGAIGVLYAVISAWATQQYLQELTQSFNRDLAKRIVADRNLVAQGRLDREALKDTFTIYMDINPSIEIYLLDMEGKILSFSADPGKVKRQRVDLDPIRRFLDGESLPLLGDDPRSHDRMKAFSVTAVPTREAPEGYLYVVLRGEQFDSVEQALQESLVVRLSAYAVAGSLGFGLLAGLLLFYRLTRRLRRLGVALNRFEQSGFNTYEAIELQGTPNDEIDALAAAYNEMAGQISRLLQELTKQDRSRRELVAQISHDLRTPLAVVHGYLETLDMNETSDNPDRRREYLGIALRQSEQLRGMVEALFELAQLEARDIKPEKEPLMVHELLQDVVLKFRPQAEARKLELELAPIERGLPLVMGDIGLLERVLDNLIANALEYTPAGGKVTVRTAIADDGLKVVVEDNGPGIPEETMAQLFEPFYRGEARSGHSRQHAGLGLSIARKIVALHDAELVAENRPGGGARFTFVLPNQQ